MNEKQEAVIAGIERARAAVYSAFAAIDDLNALAASGYSGDDERGAFAYAIGALESVDTFLDVRECDDFDFDAIV